MSCLQEPIKREDVDELKLWMTSHFYCFTGISTYLLSIQTHVLHLFPDPQRKDTVSTKKWGHHQEKRLLMNLSQHDYTKWRENGLLSEFRCYTLNTEGDHRHTQIKLPLSIKRYYTTANWALKKNMIKIKTFIYTVWS